MIIFEDKDITASEATTMLGLSKANVNTLTHADVCACPNDVCVEIINGRKVPCVVATVAESKEFVLLEYRKLLKFFEHKSWNFDVPMVFNMKEYNDFKAQRRRR